LPSTTPSSVGLQYKAFLSYSHAADGRLVEVIQSRLQRFATPWYRRRSIRVFRDTTGLGLTPDLWDAIRVALEASEYFILFASEQAARSQWVGQEVDAFLSVRSADRLLIVWTDGELCWDDAAGDFDWTRTTCLPARLRGVFHAEPLHMDLRWARTAKDLSPRRPEFLDAVARLSATLRQLPIDDLVGEDVKQYRRTRQVTAAAVAALTILLVGAVVGAVVAIQQRNLARQQREESRQSLVRLVVANGVRRLDDKDLSGSALWFAEALRLEAGAPGHDLQRLRLRSTLAQHPRLLQMWATDRPATGRSLARWVTFGRGDHYAITNAVEGDIVLGGGRPSFELGPAVEPRLWETRTGTRVQLKLPGDGLRLLAVDADANRVVIATAGAAGDVRTWNGTSGAVLARMTHPCAVKDATFSDDGRVLMTDCDDQVLRLWDFDRATLLASLQHAKPVSFAWIAANRRRVLSGTTDNTAHVWTLGPESRVVSHVQVPHTDNLQEVDVGLDGRRVLTLANYTARLWDIGDDRRPTLLESWSDVNHIELSPDGRVAVLATGYGRVPVWDLEDVREIFDVTHDDVVFDAAFSRDGTKFATASHDRSVRVWEANTGNLLTAPLYHEESISRVDFSSEHMWLATITQNEVVRVWNLETGPKYPHESVNQAAFHPDGKHVMTVSDFEVKVWDVAAWTSVSLSPRQQIYQASVNPDGQRIATASADGLVRIWNATTGAEVQSLRHGRRARQAVFSPDGRKLASAGQAAGRHEVAVWDLATGAKSLVLPHGNSYLTQIEFSPDGTRLLTIGSEGARMWDVGKGHEIPGLQVPDVDRATFDPSGTRLAMVQQRTNVLVFDATGRRLFPPLRPDNFRVTGLSFASGGRALVIATESGFVRIWDSDTGKPTTTPLGHGRATLIQHVAVSADGRFLATAGSDGTARIWHVATGQPLTPPLSHPGGVVHAAFSPDGLRLVTIGSGAVREWDLSRDSSRGSDAELSLLARLLAARRIDPTGAVSALSLDEIRAAWASKATR
jgi:WD40 repeat protein